MATAQKKSWIAWLLTVLAFEKFIQHIVVTVSFLTDWHDIRSTVVVDYRWLVVTGTIIAMLFIVATFGVWHGRHWSLSLLMALALADILGEFIAQGKIDITITVSFIVAWAILALVLILRRSTVSANG